MSWLRISLVLLTGVFVLYDGYLLADRSGGVDMTYVENGVASWYGSEEQGKPTANGEKFNRHNFTAASKHIPFNTIVKVTNEANGKSVNVRINDRGPYKKGRILDLSEAAADTLDMHTKGTAPVKVEVVEPAFSTATAAPAP